MARYLEACYLYFNIQASFLLLTDVPGVTPLVDVLGVPANCNGRTLSNTRIDGKDTPEGVRCDFMIGQSPLGARLKGAVIACSRRIKCMDRAQDRVDILGTSAIVLVDVRKDILAIPIALQKAKDLRSLEDAAVTCLTDLSCEGVSLNQSAMLDYRGEERRACRDFGVSIPPSRQDPRAMNDTARRDTALPPQHVSQMVKWSRVGRQIYRPSVSSQRSKVV